MKKNYIRIVLDLLMAVTFVLLMNPRVLDGLPFHEIAGTVIGVAILIHIGLNYRWVVNTTKKILDSKLPNKTRFGYMLNVLLLIAMAGVIITGIFISRVVFPGLAIQGSRWLRGLHGLFADSTLVLVGLHIALHWQWVMTICKKAFKTKAGKVRKGVLVPVVLSLTILAGGIQWFASTTSANRGDFMPKQMEKRWQAPTNGTSGDQTDVKQGRPDGEFRGEKFHGREGIEGHSGSSNPILVILNYFAIWTAIIVPVYYFGKRKFKNKQKMVSTDSQTL